MNGFARTRKESGLTQEEAAKEFGVERSTIAKWENGVSLPRATLIPKILDTYKCTIKDIYEK